MEAAVYFTASGVAAIPSTLITTVGDVALTDTIVQTAWITVTDTQPDNASQRTPGSLSVSTDTSILHISSPAASPQPVQGSLTPVITMSSVSNAAPQLGADPPLGDPALPCSINTASLGMCMSLR